MDKNTFAKVILASKTDNGTAPVVTIHARYPRIIHGEVLTHRVFERNGRSSRAVPVMKMIKEVWNTPFIPSYWGRNKKGMQAGEEMKGFSLWIARSMWRISAKFACVVAYIMLKSGLHKQIANRILEPFSYIDVLITSTEWENFRELRVHEDAEPHFRDLAEMIMALVDDENNYTPISIGEWHFPYVTDEEKRAFSPLKLQKLSVARCARISYAPFNGNSDVYSECERYERLVGSKPIHASPAGHQARLVDNNYGLGGCLGRGWVQFRRELEEDFK